jgi:hypothetical protein
MRVSSAIGLALVWLLASGCAVSNRPPGPGNAARVFTGAVAPVIPPYGFLFTEYHAPATADPGPFRLGPKVGRARTSAVRDPIFTEILVSWGDASVEEASRAAGITKVSHVDYRLMSVLSIYLEFETVVYGD